MADNSVIKVRLTAEGIQEVVNAFKKIEGQAKTTKKATEGIGTSLKNELRDLGIGVALRQMASFVQANLEAQAAVQDLVEVTGVSAESISVLGMAAKREGVSIESLGKGIKGVTKFMAALQEGSKESEQTLKALGLSTKDLVGKSLDQQMITLANAMDRFSSDGQSGQNKAALAMKIFGKSGLDMLQVMQQISGDGFQKLQEEGVKTGQVLSGQAALAAKQAKVEMEQLKGQVEGATNAFAQGLIPALGDAVNGLTNLGSPGSLDGFKKVGEAVGWVAKGIVSAFVVVGHTVGYIINVLSSGISNLWEDMKGGADLVKEFFTGKGTEFGGKVQAFGAARQKRTSGERDLKNAYLEQMEESLRNIWDEKSGAGGPSSSAQASGGKKNLKLPDKSAQEAAAKAAKEAAAEALAVIKRVQEDQKQLLDAGKALNEHSFKAGLIDLDTYLKERLRLTQESGDLELQVLQQQLGHELALGKEASLTKINDLRADIARRKKINEESLKEEQWKAEEERRQAVEEARKRQEEDLNKAAERANARLSNTTASLDQRQAAGLIGNGAATAQRIQAYQQWLETLQNIQWTLEHIAQQTGNADMAAKAAGLKIQIDSVKISVSQLSNEWRNVQQAGADALASGLLDTLMQVGNGANAVADSFADMARNIVSSIQQVLAKMMLMEAAEAMLGGNAAGSWQSNMLSAFGKTLGFAGGGEIHGPGTGTSDSILARLSNGEFIQRAAAVSYYGPSFMHALNGLQVPRDLLPRFADGGAVGGPSPQAIRGDFNHTLQIDLDSGLILRAVDSPEGTRVIAKIVANNPKRFNRGLGR